MSLIMITCPLCYITLTWDSSYKKESYLPIHLCETTGGQRLCDGSKQYMPKGNSSNDQN